MCLVCVRVRACSSTSPATLTRLDWTRLELSSISIIFGVVHLPGEDDLTHCGSRVSPGLCSSTIPRPSSPDLLPSLPPNQPRKRALRSAALGSLLTVGCKRYLPLCPPADTPHFVFLAPFIYPFYSCGMISSMTVAFPQRVGEPGPGLVG